uniref:Uncharacterized protein n=1 Tax=Ditylenchus dipsaci TaxID=166011 RepID=A0A915D9N1_9BILA
MVQAAKELRSWSENRMLDCIFCMDYDDYQRLSIFGCVARILCHLAEETRTEISKAKAEPKVQKAPKGVEIKLCEVTKIINTCLCTNRPFCNNVSSMEPFTEYSSSLIFGNTNFDEVAHFSEL